MSNRGSAARSDKHRVTVGARGPGAMLILGLNLMDNELRAYRREQRTVVPDAATGQTRYQSLLVHGDGESTLCR